MFNAAIIKIILKLLLIRSNLFPLNFFFNFLVFKKKFKFSLELALFFPFFSQQEFPSYESLKPKKYVWEWGRVIQLFKF
jgi:hypothetical protein